MPERTDMSSDSKNCNAECLVCVKIYEKCATECDKFDMADCKKYATDCRNTSKHCNEM
ncbi:MAG: hypothetical protein H0U95_16685 [Bacteroidetes bacterium]|nr:hypothetical protein [Bacteroidota bacterium]